MGTGLETQSISLGAHQYTYLQWYPPETQLLLTNRAGDCAMLDLSAGRLVQNFRVPTGVWGCDIHPQGHALAIATSSESPLIEVIKTESYQEGHFSLLGAKSAGLVPFFSRDGIVVLANDWSQQLRMWTLTQHEPVLVRNSRNFDNLVFSPDNNRVGPEVSGREVRILRIATGADTCCQVWEAKSGQHLVNLTSGPICTCRFSPLGTRLIVYSGAESTCRVYQTETWEPQGEFLETKAMGVFSPDETLFAVPAGAGDLLLCRGNLHHFARLSHIDDHALYPLGFAHDNSRLYARDMEANTIHIWDFALIRQQLAKISLADDWPKLPPPINFEHVPPVRLTILTAAGKVGDGEGDLESSE